jgi:hypothetical protein
MLLDFVIHELIAVPWAPLNFLVSLPGPLPYPPTTNVFAVYGTFRTVLCWFLVLRILVHEQLEDSLDLGMGCPVAPDSTLRKIPTAPARLVTTIEVAGMGFILLPAWGLIGATVLEDQQSPSTASVAIVSSLFARMGANNSTVP